MSYTTEVTVYKNDKPVRGYEVLLEFAGNGGFTGKFMTDSSGIAYVEHDSRGRVYVYIDGNHSNHGTTGDAPGQIDVYL